MWLPLGLAARWLAYFRQFHLRFTLVRGGHGLVNYLRTIPTIGVGMRGSRFVQDVVRLCKESERL